MKRVNVAQSKYVKTLVYAYPGSGKTHLLGTFALDERTAPVLHIDCGGNPETLGKFERIPDVVRLEKISELNAIHDWLVKKQPKDHPMVTQMGLVPGYKTLNFDGISDGQRYSFDAVMATEGSQIASITRAAEWADYRGVLSQMTKISKALFALEMHVMMTAWEKAETDIETGFTRYRPFLQGQSIDTVPGYALSIGRMIIPSRADGQIAKLLKDNPTAKSIIIFQPTKSYDAKDQNGFNVNAMLDPTATKLLDLIEVH